MNASSSPEIVPVPMSDAAAVDPEEAFVASLSSCHMLWFLAIAAKAGFSPIDYRDEASGELEPDEGGKLAITVVTLRPRLSWVENLAPSTERIAQMHAEAHAECFIANSVKSDVLIK